MHDDLTRALMANVDISVASIAHLHCVANAVYRTGRIAAVHLKVDSGLSRSGALPGDWPALMAAARHLEARGVIRIAGIWSHLGNAEDSSDPHHIGYLRAAC